MFMLVKISVNLLSEEKSVILYELDAYYMLCSCCCSAYLISTNFWKYDIEFDFILFISSIRALRLCMRDRDFAVCIALIVLTNVSGAIGVLSTIAGTILVEKECYFIIMSSGN
ncbi:hypothetical protein MKX01_036753 [Papaver californicum]|nr:hypothetical protein MKX01_036753 [Papaver californicum]